MTEKMKTEFEKQKNDARENIRMALDAAGVPNGDILPLIDRLVDISCRCVRYDTIVEMETIIGKAYDRISKEELTMKVEVVQSLG